MLNAFSREGPEKDYVQDQILQEATKVLTVLNSGASVYVCGAADMAAGEAPHDLVLAQDM